MSGKILDPNIKTSCSICGTMFLAKRVNNLYCSKPCNRKAQYEKFKNKNPDDLEAIAERVKINSRKNRGSLIRFRDAVKLTAGCADCGYNSHPSALDFDHLDDYLKTNNIHAFSTIRTAVLEMEKCEVVCANCHRIRTCERGQGFYGKLNGRNSSSLRNIS